ncbi:MAG: hypothetical protein LBE37_16990 [Sphingobacterium sp.]|jgi:hypothetical protein|nr:hypothetical protein [Sphingobacterium sp.]
MKRIKTVRTSLFTLILAFFAIGTFAIANEVMNKENVEQAEVPYYYIGPQTSNMITLKNPANWQTSQPAEFNCGGEEEVPCSIPATSASHLQTKLSTASTLDDVLAIASNRREASN